VGAWSRRAPPIGNEWSPRQATTFGESNSTAPPETVPTRTCNLQVAVRKIARLPGNDISEEQPILDVRLPDGSRVAAVMPPCRLHGTAPTIRKFRPAYFTLEELVTAGTVSTSMADALHAAIERRHTILISGGTGTGKTTLLNALAARLPPDERVVVVEETAELQITVPNVVRLEERRAQRELSAMTMRDLLRAMLRHRPDRILVGKVRGGEAYDLLQALNNGHAGALCTIHASAAVQALSRLTSCVLQAGVDVSYAAVRHQIGEAVQGVAHLPGLAGTAVSRTCSTCAGTAPMMIVPMWPRLDRNQAQAANESRTRRSCGFPAPAGHDVVPAHGHEDDGRAADCFTCALSGSPLNRRSGGA